MSFFFKKPNEFGIEEPRLFLMLAIVLFVMVVLPFVVLGVGWDQSYSEGARRGTITKFSKKGLFWKTWEGEMVLGGLKSQSNGDKGTTMVANIWQFSVPDEELAQRIMDAFERGEPMGLQYTQVMIHSYRIADTDYYVHGIADDKKE